MRQSSQLPIRLGIIGERVRAEAKTMQQEPISVPERHDILWTKRRRLYQIEFGRYAEYFHIIKIGLMAGVAPVCFPSAMSSLVSSRSVDLAGHKEHISPPLLPALFVIAPQQFLGEPQVCARRPKHPTP